MRGTHCVLADHRLERRFENVGQGRFTNPAERERRERDAELCRGDIRIQMRDDLQRGSRTQTPFVHQFLKARAADGDDGEFGGDEETVGENQESYEAKTHEFGKLHGSLCVRNSEIQRWLRTRSISCSKPSMESRRPDAYARAHRTGPRRSRRSRSACAR